MKTNLLIATAVIAAGVSGPANSAFTALTDNSTYELVITGGCFAFGNCVSSGTGALVDNSNLGERQTDITFNTDEGSLPAGVYGSGIAGDGVVGRMEFTFNAGRMAITTYSQDSYLNTLLGTFYLDGLPVAMSGTIDNVGNMTIDTTGRYGLSGSFATSLGHNPWNIDDSINGSGLTDIWTTGTSSSRAANGIDAFTLEGMALTDDGNGGWTGVLVSAGNTGSSWGGLDNMPYSECFRITIRGPGGSGSGGTGDSGAGCSMAVSAVPIPAAVWLFASGLLGLAGFARRV